MTSREVIVNPNIQGPRPRLTLLWVGLLFSSVGFSGPADSPPQAAPAAVGTPVSPAERVASAPRGTLKNPYTGQEDKIAQGKELFMSYSCSGCHGGTGGGGMCPPINGEVWFYGIDDDVLFRLITLGSVEMQKQGLTVLGVLACRCHRLARSSKLMMSCGRFSRGFAVSIPAIQRRRRGSGVSGTRGS